MCKSRSITTASSFAFSAIASCFPQLLKHDTNMVASYHVVPYLQCCYASLVISNAVHSYWKVLHKGCNTDVLRVLPHSPSGTVRPRDNAHISLKPLAAVLKPINNSLYLPVYIYQSVISLPVCFPSIPKLQPMMFN